MQHYTYFEVQELFSQFPQYKLIQQHPSLFPWESFDEENNEKKTAVSPLFQSLTSEQQEKLLQESYGLQFIQEELRKIEDGEHLFLEVEDYLTYLLVQLQVQSTFTIVDGETGEILADRFLNPANLRRTIEEICPGIESFEIHIF